MKGKTEFFTVQFEISIVIGKHPDCLQNGFLNTGLAEDQKSFLVRNVS
jgi:hypothetical protein